jgi:hypothetical protein
MKMELFFFSAIILVGFLDWLTTFAGVLFFGAAEANPFLSGLTKSSMLLFSIVKLSAVLLVGSAFYKAAAIGESTIDWHFAKFTKQFLYGGFSLTFLFLSVVAASNMITLFRI